MPMYGNDQVCRHRPKSVCRTELLSVWFGSNILNLTFVYYLIIKKKNTRHFVLTRTRGQRWSHRTRGASFAWAVVCNRTTWRGDGAPRCPSSAGYHTLAACRSQLMMLSTRAHTAVRNFESIARTAEYRWRAACGLASLTHPHPHHHKKLTHLSRPVSHRHRRCCGVSAFLCRVRRTGSRFVLLSQYSNWRGRDDARN